MVMAAVGYIPAVAGALAQELVDLATILNALRALSPGRNDQTQGNPDTGSAQPGPYEADYVHELR